MEWHGYFPSFFAFSFSNFVSWISNLVCHVRTNNEGQERTLKFCCSFYRDDFRSLSLSCHCLFWRGKEFKKLTKDGFCDGARPFKFSVTLHSQSFNQVTPLSIMLEYLPLCPRLLAEQKIPSPCAGLLDGSFSDVTLLATSGQTFPAHKCILAGMLCLRYYFVCLFCAVWLLFCCSCCCRLLLNACLFIVY